LSGHALDHRLHLILLRHIAGDEQRLASEGTDFVGRLLAGRFVQIDDRHVGAGPRQRHGTAAADADRAAGDESFLAGQIE